jgi:hypothetical protein
MAGDTSEVEKKQFEILCHHEGNHWRRLIVGRFTGRATSCDVVCQFVRPGTGGLGPRSRSQQLDLNFSSIQFKIILPHVKIKEKFRR